MISNFPGALLWIVLIVVLLGMVALVGAWIHLMTKHPCPHCQKLMDKKATVCPYCGKGALVTV
jgi:hypothetical protein